MPVFSDPPFSRRARLPKLHRLDHTQNVREFDLNYQHYFFGTFHVINNTDAYKIEPKDTVPVDLNAPSIRSYDSPPIPRSYYSDPSRSSIHSTRTLSPLTQPATMTTRHTTVSMPAHAPSISRSSILILPARLASMIAQIRHPHRRETHRLSVVPNMRLRDAVKQLLGSDCDRDDAVKIYVNNRGTWMEPERDVRVKDLREAARAWRRDGEVEIKVVIGGERGEGDGGRGGGRRHAGGSGRHRREAVRDAFDMDTLSIR